MYNFWEALPPLQFGRAKKSFKNRCDLRQLLSLSDDYISGSDEASDKIQTAMTRKSLWRWIKKNCEIPFTTNKVISAHVDLP